MGQLFADISARIPANKFYPPRFASAQSLFRSRLVDDLLGRKGRGKKVFLLEAQAGQGKTTLVSQYLDHAGADYVWYQVGLEDNDPIVFLTALLVSLKKALPSFGSSLLEKMIADGEVTVLELERYVNILLADLDAVLSSDFFVVFDDFHLLEGNEDSLGLVEYMVKTAPPRLRFILASRRAISLTDRMLEFGRDALHLDNKLLAMDESEAAELLNGFLETPLPPRTVRDIHHATDGWVMGLILVGHALEKERVIKRLQDIPATLGKGQVPVYFKEEILAQLPPDLHAHLLKLSFLERIPVSLAGRICDDAAIGEKLTGLMRNNFFVRGLDEENSVFALHHLFQEFLQELARQQLSEKEIRQVCEQAAGYWLEHKRPQEALVYYLKAGDYPALEKLLEQEGLALLAMNRVATLSGVIRQIPEEVVRKSGWFSYFAGAATMLKSPKPSYPFFEVARVNFIKEENMVGELLAIAELINYHMAFDGSYNKGLVYLRRAEELFAANVDALDTYCKILVAHNIASGFCFFEMNMSKAEYYSLFGLELARRHGLDNYAGRILIVHGFTALLAGDYRRAREIAEQAHDLIWSPRVDVVSRVGLRTLLLDILEKTGDFDEFARLQNQTFAAPEGSLVHGTVVGPLLIVWNADVAIARGDLGEAEKILKRGLDTDYGSMPHMRSQFLHYLAFIDGARQRKSEAIDALEESRRLRAEVGGPYYLVLNDLMFGATYAQLMMKDQAQAYLARAIEGAEEIGVEYFKACAFMHRAFLRITNGSSRNGREDLARGLRIMRRNGYEHLHAWTPQTARTLLGAAVKHGIESDFAAGIAARRFGEAVLEDGSMTPLLKIRVLGEFVVEKTGKEVLRAGDFTPSQRQLLALLITSPDLKIRQEYIQLTMWPDSDPVKARSRLDSLLSRLRKTMPQGLGGDSIKGCLKLKKGILGFDDCRVDAVEFLEMSRKGFDHANRNEWWQAGNAFRKALDLWQGCFLDQMSVDEQVDDFCAALRQRTLDMAGRWSDKLIALGRLAEAVDIYEHLRHHDPEDAEPARRLYSLHILRRDPAAAQAVLARYRQTLERADYSPEEVEELMRSLLETV